MSLRPALSFVALALIALSNAQDLEKKIDYTTRAVPLQRAFDEMSKQAGVKLFAQEDLQNEIIILRLKDVSLDEAMKKIADTVGAEWRKVPDGYEMDRSPELTKTLEDQALEAKAQFVKKGLDTKRKALNLDKALTDSEISSLVARMITADKQGRNDNWRETLAIQESTPDERELFRVLSRIDPKEIASIPNDRRFVFSNKPTKMQRLIDGDFADDADILIDEHNRLVDAYAKSKPKVTDPNAPPSMYFYEVTSATKLVARPDRFVLTVGMPMMSDSIQLELLVFDAQGHPILSSSANLQLEKPGGIMAERARVSKATQGEAEIQVTPITKQFLDYMRRAQSGQGGAGAEPISGDLRQAVLHPEDTDPLAFATSEAFLGVAEHRNENLVFYADDMMYLVGLFAGMDGSLKPSLVMQSLSSLGEQTQPVVSEHDGWLTIQPGDRIATLKDRLNRAALGAYLREDVENGFVTIASSAKLASSIKGTELPMLGMFIPMLISPDLQFTTGDVSMLKLYASLDDSQLSSLHSHGLRVADFSENQLDLLTSYAYGNTDYNSRLPMNPGKLTQAEVMTNEEPTETMPNGLTSDFLLSMQSANTNIYFAKIATDSYTSIDSVDINTLTYYINQGEHPDDSRGDWHPRVQSIQPGQETKITLYLNLAKFDVMMAELKEHHRVPGGPWTLDNMPDELKQKINTLKQQQFPPSQGGTPPPPPPMRAL